MRRRNRAGQSAPFPDEQVISPGVPAAAPVPSPSQAAAPQQATTPSAEPMVAAPGAGQAPAQPAAAPHATPPHHVVRRTRAGGVWVGLALSAVVLLLLLVFILENQQSASIGYFGAHGHLPLGVALLLAAVAGALLVVIPGSARIVQLRRTARRHRAMDTRRRGSGSQASPPAPPQTGGPA